MARLEEIIIKRWTGNDKLIVPRRTPLAMSGIIEELLKDYYRHNSNQFKFSDNPVESKLLIDLHQQWNPTNCENYPGIYVKRGAWNYRAEGKVLGNYKSLLMEDGLSYEFWVPVTVNYSIICIGKEYGEIELLLDETSTFLTVFSDPISRFFNFHRFDTLQVSPVGIYQEEKNYRIGQIELSILFDFIWKLTLEKPPINNVKLRDQ